MLRMKADENKTFSVSCREFDAEFISTFAIFLTAKEVKKI